MKKILISIFAVLGVILFYGNNVYASEKIGTSGLRFLVVLYGTDSYNWTNRLLFNQTLVGPKYSRAWEFTTSTFTSTGTNAVINFTTEMYFDDNAPYQSPWVNTDYMDVLYCDFNGTRLQKIGSNVSYGGSTVSYPSSGTNIARSTSKWIGNVGLGGLPKNTSGQITCAVGSYSYVYFDGYSVSSAFDGSIAFKSNDTYITMTDDSANQLLQEQIVQTQQLIDINKQIEEQIRQNQIKIDELNQQIVQTQQDIQAIENAITDSNVSGNFDVNILQGFGPISGIINGILGIPQTILQVNSCSNIQAPLPFVNNNLEIPCMGQVLRNMAGGFIDFADVILSAYLYFRLAIYIFRQVQQMRDPTNNKEDYLDL